MHSSPELTDRLRERCDDADEAVGAAAALALATWQQA
jgi:hypothetical protein